MVSASGFTTRSGRTVRPPSRLRPATDQKASLRPKNRAISKRSGITAGPFGSTELAAQKDGAPKPQDFVLPVKNIALQVKHSDPAAQAVQNDNNQELTVVSDDSGGNAPAQPVGIHPADEVFDPEDFDTNMGMQGALPID
eukprot:COSAG01_NODE_3509_length_5988_cov_30.489810_4_plen_140_part_00